MNVKLLVPLKLHSGFLKDHLNYGMMGLLLIILSGCLGSNLEGPQRESPILEEPPILQSSTPSFGGQASPPEITVTGEFFLASSAVRVGNNTCTNKFFVSENEIRCTPPSNLPPGLYTLSVAHPDGSTSFLSDSYRVIPQPNITSISPVGRPLIGGGALTITGSGFTQFFGGPQVTLGGASCTAPNVTSSSTMTCTIPAGVAGLADLQVTNPGNGIAELANAFEYLNNPLFTSVTPEFGHFLGGELLTITGSRFSNHTGNPMVSIGGANCSSVNFISTTTLECFAPALAAGDYAITVTNRSGQTVTSGSVYSSVPAPVVTSFSPVGGVLAGGTLITFNGSQFSSEGAGTTATIAGSPCVNPNVVSTSEFTCESPAGVTGLATIVLTNPGGATTTLTNSYQYNPDPIFTSVAPAFGPISGGTAITITGNNFSDHTALPEVTIGGDPCTSLVRVSATELTCTTPAQAAGAADLVITNASTQTVTAVGAFTYLAAPTIASITPEFAALGDTPDIVLTGTLFSNLAPLSISVGGVACTASVYNNATTATCTVSAALPAGEHDIVLTNPDGQTAILVDAYNSFANPTITSISPVGGPENTAIEVTITGTNFTSANGGTAVEIGGEVCTGVVVNSSTSLTCDAPVIGVGTQNVEVVNPAGSGAVLLSGYEYLDAPSFTSIAPAFGSLLGGDLVTITGTNFSTHLNDPTVTIGGAACLSVTVNSATELTCLNPARPMGSANLVVTNHSGLSFTEAGAFEYIGVPTISSISPVGGVPAGGTVITITGTNFSNLGTGMNIQFGLDTCNAINFVNSTILTCETPAIAPGLSSITLTSPAGEAVTGTNIYEYRPDPNITSITPAFGSNLGNAALTIVGANFSNHTALPTVTIGGEECNSLVFVDNTTLTCNSPALTVGDHDLIVTNPSGQAVTVTDAFESLASPTLTTLTPSYVTVGSSFPITVNGTNFSNLAPINIAIGGVNCVTTNYVSATQATCDLPSLPVGIHSVVFRNADGQTATLSNSFTVLGVPTITGYAPTGGLIAGGTNLIITGTNFTSLGTDTEVSIGGAICAINAITTTQISCTTAARAAGVYDLTVTNPGVDGGSTTSLGAFQYSEQPVILDISPEASTLAGGVEIIITGEHFSNHLAIPTILIGSQTCLTPVFDSTEVIRCTVQAGTVGSKNIVMTMPTQLTASLAGGFTYVAPPTLSAISPVGSALVGGGTLTLTGTQFTEVEGGTTVNIGGSACSIIDVLSPTSLTCTIPSGVAGLADVVVTNPGLTQATLANSFEYRDDPTIIAITPNYGSLIGGQLRTITGTNFSNHTALPIIEIGGSACTSLNFVTNTELNCLTPALTAGDHDVVITNPSGQQATLVGGFSSLATPTLTTVAPEFASALTITALTLTGTNFYTGAPEPTVTVGGVACVPSAVNATSIDCDLPATLAAGLHDIIVTNPDGQTVTLADSFTSLAPPTISSVAPVGGVLAGGTSIVITGTNFTTVDTGSLVTVGGINCTPLTVDSSTQITCTTGGHAEGIVDVIVTNPDTIAATATAAYSYLDDPLFASVAPTVIPASGATITITGSRFSNHTALPTVTVGGSACTGLTYTSATEVICTAPALTSGLKDLVITNPSGQAVTEVGAITYLDPPSLTSIAPTFATAGSTDLLTLTGTHFSALTPALTVTVGGLPCTGANYVSATEVNCNLPAALTAGTYSVVLTNPDGETATLSNSFQSLAAPTLASVSPVGGVEAGGTSITVTGTNFSNLGAGPSITVGGSPCSSIVYNSATSVTCTTPAGTALADIVLTNPGGATATLANSFEYRNDPTFVSISPVFGAVTGGTLVTITGTLFSNHTADPAVTIGGVSCAGVTYNSATELTCTTGAGVAGARDIVITQASGQTVTATAAYTYTAAPIISNLSTAIANASGGTIITLTGQHFLSGLAVEIEGTPCTNSIYLSSTSATCETPALAVGVYDLTLTNPDTLDVTLTDAVSVQAEPTIASISPSFGPQTGGTTITITGTNFDIGVTVLFSQGGCTSINRINSTQLTCLTTASVGDGNTDVTVRNPNTFEAVSTSGFVYLGPPTITSVTPSTGAQGGGTSVTIDGTNFEPPLTITIGGIACSVTSVNTTQAVCTTGANNPGLYSLILENIDGQTIIETSAFTYTNDATVAWIAGDPDYGSTTAFVTETFTLENTGPFATGNLTISLTGGQSVYWAIQSDLCTGTTLDIGETCDVDILFRAGSGTVPSGGPYATTLRMSAPFLGNEELTLTGSKP